MSSLGQLPLSFEANRGQTDPRVKFLSRGSGYTLFLTRRGEAVLALCKPTPKRDPQQRVANVPSAEPDLEHRTPSAVVRMNLVGVSTTPQLEGLEELPGKANYFIGNDPKKWRTNVPTFAKVKYRNIYPGVDLVYYGYKRQLEHDFIVGPGADPHSITLNLVGMERMSLDAQGSLVLGLKEGEVRFGRPRVYQEVDGARREISGGYSLKSAHEVGFQVAAYDASKPLIIDPTLSYSTYLGGSGGDIGQGIAVDGAGDAYVTGQTFSSNFPTTAGAFQTTAPGGAVDAFVTKLNTTGSALVYSTYLGGSNADQGFGIAVDSHGQAYVTGITRSANFPTTAGAFQTSLRGNYSAFVTKLDASGSSLVYSTYLGGSNADLGFGIAVDSPGQAYVTGSAGSSDFPTTAGAYQTTLGVSGFNAFVTKLNALGSALVYSTYLGGSGPDEPRGIAVDTAGDAYVTGQTASSNFPTSPGAFQTSPGGGGDAFVTELNTTGSALVYSTYLGGSAFDVAWGIAVDSRGHAYVTGQTLSSNFPTTAGAFQTSFGGGTDDAFVTELNTGGSSLVYSTYLGGNSNDMGFGIAVDTAGNAFVTGETFSSNFPTTPNAIQPTSGSPTGFPPDDAFVTVLNPLGTTLVYSSYLGGSDIDAGNGIAVDASFSAYVTGATRSTDFPTTMGAFQTKNMGAFDAFVTKIANIVCTTEDDDERGDREQRDHKHRDHKHKGKIHPCKEVESEERDSEKE